jgi:hypothetical protein
MEYLATIGQFVGTYGLAVFLVVYYAIKLYPQVEAERGKWIEEITRLRQLVDPATRSLTRHHAEAILKLAAYSFFELVRSNRSRVEAEEDKESSGISTYTSSVTTVSPPIYQEPAVIESTTAQTLEGSELVDSDGSSQAKSLAIAPIDYSKPSHEKSLVVAPVFSDQSSEVKSFNIWGETFQYVKGNPVPMNADERQTELIELLQSFSSARESENDRIRDRLINTYEDMNPTSKIIGYQLGRLRFGDSTLEEVWNKAANKLRDYWRKEVPKVDPTQQGYEVKQFLGFVKEHPVYGSLRNSKPEIFAILGSEKKITIDDLFSNGRTTFERFLLEELDSMGETIITSR